MHFFALPELPELRHYRASPRMTSLHQQCVPSLAEVSGGRGFRKQRRRDEIYLFTRPLRRIERRNSVFRSSGTEKARCNQMAGCTRAAAAVPDDAWNLFRSLTGYSFFWTAAHASMASTMS